MIPHFHFLLYTRLLEEVIEMMCPPAGPLSWTWAIGGSSLPLLSLKRTFCPPFSYRKLPQGCSLERVQCYWDYLDYTQDWTPLIPLYKFFKVLEGSYGDLFILWPPKTSLICHFPCLLKLLHTNLEWFLSLVSPWLPCTGARFRLYLELLRLWTNTDCHRSSSYLSSITSRTWRILAIGHLCPLSSFPNILPKVTTVTFPNSKFYLDVILLLDTYQCLPTSTVPKHAFRDQCWAVFIN